MRTLRERFGRQRWTEPNSRSAAPLVATEKWNTLSTLGAGSIADVDDRGAVFARSRPVSIEVWFGAGDKWVRGSAGDGLRQSRVVGLPIVETRQRVGDADVVQTAWADESGDSHGRVIVKLENETDVAVVAAVVVRPHALRGRGWIEEARVAGTRIIVDKRPLVDVGRTPGDVAVAIDDDRAAPALLKNLLLDRDGLVGSDALQDGEGRASLAALIPLTPGVARQIEILDGREASSVAAAPLENVVAGWRSHLEHAAEFEVPAWPKHVPVALMSSLLGAAVDADGPVGDDLWQPADDTLLVAALAGVGLDWAAATVAGRLLEAVTEGRIERSRWPGLAAACATVAGTPAGDAVLAQHPDATIALAGHALAKARAIGIVQPLLRAVQAAHGVDAAADAAAIEGRLIDSADGVAYARHGLPAPAESAGDIDEILDSAPRPLDAATIGLAMAAAAQLDRPFEPLVPLRSLAGSSWRWPRNGCGDSPHSRAALLVGLRALCISEYPGGPADDPVTLESPADIDVFPGMTSSWLGQNMQFKRLPTSAGALSVALRWHGERAALLWEFDGDSDRPFTISCTAIDPTFRTSDRSGEALLEAPTHLVSEAKKSLL